MTEDSETIETTDRYVMEVDAKSERVHVYDTRCAPDESPLMKTFAGPVRLMHATEYAEMRNEGERNGWKPSPLVVVPSFMPQPYRPLLAEMKRQRLELALAEVRDAERTLVRDLANVAGLLNQATDLRERLERDLEGLVSPLSATLREQNDPRVVQGTPWSDPAANPLSDVQDFYQRATPLLSKPGPY